MMRFRFFSKRILGSMLLGGLTGGKGNLLVTVERLLVLARPKKVFAVEEQSIPGLNVGLCKGESTKQRGIGESGKSGTANCMIRVVDSFGIELCKEKYRVRWSVS